MDLARKVTEERMSSCLLNSSEDLEEELVSIYSALVDEDKLVNDADEIITDNELLKNVEDQLTQKGENPVEKAQLLKVKNKILDRVRSRKVERKARKDSISSIKSSGSKSEKRNGTDQAGGDNSRVKTELVTASPLLIKQ